ncbi:hypothetical protein BTHERMOSOX_163 [Bathymodiolus thermophilus thioautotrophic gill symbiont]|uniref:Uncharacterized protein n=1 Tax=Bathymodiolus thermophilus thioautotrophic gill symbiont TaxID=2360 RepID=A0A8H8XFT8_9GAMM|nr:hypothetical protein THERMOT_576 [Bathymodiolus thermophilus thioautotrophic gill symbiont]CAB5504573.1 hypothetical protein THERMOS_1983 [Bathymodiolus thermophilus thioautotrophic gill symbiont]SGZ78677.1 hypothetical protein BTHERMOSOX_163 [Bathymodiolus thermophilus thioautotrophic gill symbiont]
MLVFDIREVPLDLGYQLTGLFLMSTPIQVLFHILHKL